MKFYKQFLLLFVVFALLSGVFSIPASADTLDTTVKVNCYAYDEHNAFGQLNVLTGQNDDESWLLDFGTRTFNKSTWYYRQRFTFTNSNSSPLFYQDKTYSFTANNLIMGYGYNTTNLYYSGAVIIYYRYVYSDGTTSNTFTDSSSFDVSFDTTRNTYSFSHKFTAEKDINKLIVWFEQNTVVPSEYINKSTNFWVEFGAGNSDYPFNVRIDEQSEEAGLLSGLLSWVKDIWNKLSDTFDAILELPSKLWQLISDGLKSLFVPSEEYMSQYSDKWDELLADRFGALYQVGSLLTTFFDNLQITHTSTITLPLVSLDSVGIPFSFGGYDVQIVPDGFEFLVEALQIITTVICGLFFVNALRKRYDEVMGVEQ